MLRYLNRLKADGRIRQSGNTAASRYELSFNDRTVAGNISAAAQTGSSATARLHVSPAWSPAARSLLAELDKPLGARAPVSYQRRFVDDYRPNETFLLPATLANDLYQEGRMQGQQPAGTYARNVIAPLLIDLSYSSSKLEGNRYSRLDTEILFQAERIDPHDKDAIMLLNHKHTIEFLVDDVPLYGLNVMVVRNIHELLMQGLLHDENSLGTIRQKIVSIGNTVYVPTQMSSLLDEMLRIVVDKAREIKNPVEAAFFLWLNIAYLQPFEDGNRRTSRITANIPLLMYNCAPLSFLDVSESDYSQVKIGVYERLDTSVATDLFAWTYRRSIQKYAAQIQAAGVPDPFRNTHREAISLLVARVVREGQSLSAAIPDFGLPDEDGRRLLEMVKLDLNRLGEHNFARYRLTPREVTRWIEAGRPVAE